MTQIEINPVCVTSRVCFYCTATESLNAPFVKGKNKCKACQSTHNAKYREENADRLSKSRKEYWNRINKENKRIRSESVRNSYQVSPKAFMRCLLYHIRKSSRKKLVAEWKLNAECIKVDIDIEYLCDLFMQQNGKCALSNLDMAHLFNNPMSISIDRIDSNKGYIRGNVQLLCKCFNHMKNNMSNQMAKIILEAYFQDRLERT